MVSSVSGLDVQPRRAPVALRHLWPLHGILFGINFLGILISERDPQPLKKVDQKNLAQEARHPHNGSRITGASGQWPVVSGQWLVKKLTWGQPPSAVLRAQLEGLSFAPGTSVAGTFRDSIFVILSKRILCERYLAKLPPKAQLMLALPLVAIAYPVVMIVLPAIIRAVVPMSCRSVLSLI